MIALALRIVKADKCRHSYITHTLSLYLNFAQPAVDVQHPLFVYGMISTQGQNYIRGTTIPVESFDTLNIAKQ